MLLSLVPLTTAPAQTTAPTITTSTRREITGRVVNALDHSPVRGAVVEVIPLPAGAAVARVDTHADGSFTIAGVRPARYRLRVRALGYTPRSVTIDVAAHSTVDVGAIALTTAPLRLQAQVITGQQRQIQLEPDRDTYDVRDMPTTRGGSVIDVLRNVPSVDVDIDNTISLRGNTGVVVQINGRKSPLQPAQLGDFLAQLPADMVAKVEVVPNPSARDDPEGQAGIINIVLKQHVEAGRSGGITVTGGTTGRVQLGGNMGYEHGPLTLYGSYGFMRANRPRTSSVFRENLFSDPLTYLAERGRRTQTPLSHTVTGSAEYRVTDRDALSADVMYSTRSENGTNDILYDALDSARAITGITSRLSTRTHDESNFESTLAYRHTFAGERHTLSSELRVFRGSEGGPTHYTTDALAEDGTVLGTPALQDQTGWEHPRESYFKVDYAQPLGANLRLETGYKGSLQQYHTTLGTTNFDPAAAAFVADTSLTSDFTYRQLVNAAYGMLDAQLGKFVLQGGLRAEHATTRFHLTTRDLSYDHAYNSLFPTALVAYNVDAARQIKLSYSTRIRRPDDGDRIDPTPHVQDPLNVSRGNPYLEPEYTRAVELGLQQTTDNVTLQLTPYLRHTLDAVRRIRTIDSTGVATTTFANVATTDNYGVDATAGLTGGVLSGFAGASAFRRVSTGVGLLPGLTARTFGWTARTNVTWHASRALDVQSLIFYRAPMTVEQGKTGAFARFSIAAREKLMHDRVNVTLRVIDPFTMQREHFVTIDPAFYQVTDQRRRDRGLILSVNWSFGKPPKLHAPDEGDESSPGDGGPA